VAWQRSVNAAGGIDGHQVELLIGDDGGDAATSLSIARDFVENKGVVALTYVGSSTTLGDYARSKSVPMIGTITSGEVWSQNPFLFMPFGGGETVSFGAARLTRLSGATTIATMYCAETSDCADGNDRLGRYAPQEGVEIVAEIQYSVTQPDFTAECLRLRNSGAQAVLPLGDNSSLVRMVQSCARQGVRPTWIIPSADDSMAAIPEFDGSIALTPAFPWFLRSGGPAVDEYVQALRTYAPTRLEKGVSYQAWGWQSAKLLEAAARGRLSSQPTSQNILDGLWALNGETLGGLAPGKAARTFSQGQPSKETFCVYETRISGGEWVAPQGLTPVCR
jgi:branched-chain amino acid transport system substrate-binding protein